jgi:Arc/MetJ-type ribon-helix-helix transcriptional regulator
MSHYMTRRTHIVIPEELATQIDALVGKRRRSQFLTEAAKRELQRLRQLKALESARGAWKDKAHPELARGAVRWVKTLRRENEKRLAKVQGR